MFSLADSSFYYLSFFMNTGPDKLNHFRHVGKGSRKDHSCSVLTIWPNGVGVGEEVV